MTNQTLVLGGEAGRWEQAIYAFLAEKERRSGSMLPAASGYLLSGLGMGVTIKIPMETANNTPI